MTPRLTSSQVCLAHTNRDLTPYPRWGQVLIRWFCLLFCSAMMAVAVVAFLSLFVEV